MVELKSSDASIRANAIVNIVLFGQGAMDAVPILVDRCMDRDASPRVKAVLALKVMPVREKDVPRIVDALAARLSDDSQSIIRYEAAVALALRYSDKAKAAIPALIKRMDDANCWEIRHMCILGLRRAAYDPMGGPDPRVVQAMIIALRDPVERVRLEATVCLGALGRPTDPHLLASVVRALQQQLTYKDKLLALWSHVSLMALDDKVTEKSLQSIVKLLQSPERDVRVQVLTALGAIGHKARTCVPAALEALEDKEKEVVAAACTALPHMAEPTAKVLEGLIKASKRKEAVIIQAACTSLGDLGHTDPAAVAALTAVTERKELNDDLLQSVRRILEDAKKPPKK
jgi:HEAT repeat protein